MTRYKVVTRPPGSSSIYGVEDRTDGKLVFASDKRADCIIWIGKWMAENEDDQEKKS